MQIYVSNTHNIRKVLKILFLENLAICFLARCKQKKSMIKLSTKNLLLKYSLAAYSFDSTSSQVLFFLQELALWWHFSLKRFHYILFHFFLKLKNLNSKPPKNS